MTKQYRDPYEQVEADYSDDTYVLQFLKEVFPLHSTEYYPPGHHRVKTKQEPAPPTQKEWSIVASKPPGLDKKQGYYDVGGIEVIDYIKAKLTPEQYKGYLLGNIYKYSGRMQYKGEETKDILKLNEYTHWLKEFHESNA